MKSTDKLPRATAPNIWHDEKTMPRPGSTIIMRNKRIKADLNYVVGVVAKRPVKFICNDAWEWAYFSDYVAVFENDTTLALKNPYPRPVFEALGDISFANILGDEA